MLTFSFRYKRYFYNVTVHCKFCYYYYNVEFECDFCLCLEWDVMY